jgi:hypothetical protein
VIGPDRQDERFNRIVRERAGYLHRRFKFVPLGLRQARHLTPVRDGMQTQSELAKLALDLLDGFLPEIS